MLKILLISPLRYAASMPFVMESIRGFSQRGYRIDVVVSESADPEFNCDYSGVTDIRYVDVIEDKRKYRKYIDLIKVVRTQIKNESYDLIIGLSQIGLILAWYFSSFKNIPYVFYNDELWFGNERNSLLGKCSDYIFKFLERRANKNALLTVTQDELRGGFLAKINKITIEKMRYLPNSRAGRANIIKSYYLHDVLGIDKDMKVILWMGAVSPNDGALELAQMAQEWPSDYKMVFHFRSDELTEYKKSILSCHGVGQVYVSDKTIPYENIDDFVASAAVGLGVYPDRGINARYIGASSGKINSFLKFGVPCIASDFEGLKWIEEGGAGECISDLHEVLAACQKILSNYESYRKNCIDIYTEKLFFDEPFNMLCDEIEQGVSN